MTSVVIAAHDEAAVLGRTLSSLQRCWGEVSHLQVVVVANGCHDETAAVARRHGVEVVETEHAGKAAALNLGDAVARGFPRIYLDADIEVPPGLLAALTDLLQDSTGLLAAAPARHVDVVGRPLLVRAYVAINSRLPAFREGLFGRGVVALSESGRARFGTFPLLVADDLFLDSLFTDEEKRVLAEKPVVVQMPRRGRDLVRRLVRVRRGNAAMRATVGGQVRPADRAAWLRDVVLPQPWLAPAGLVYAAITLVVALLARRDDDPGWARDGSTRVPVTDLGENAR